MNQSLILIIVLLITIGLYLYRKQKRPMRKGGRRKVLWEECRRQLRLPPKEADEAINRHIEVLKKRHPDKSEEWYLDKILYDLGRERK